MLVAVAGSGGAHGGGGPGGAEGEEEEEEGRGPAQDGRGVGPVALNREDLLRIWADPRGARLRGRDERKVRRLLLKFNGKFEDYRDWAEDVARRMRREEEGKTQGFHIDFENQPEPVQKDIDARCRQVQKEIDSAAHNSNATMWSSALRGTEQAFPTRVLRQALENELNGLLREQVYERERAQRFAIEDEPEEEFDSDATSSDSEADQEEEEMLRNMGYRERIKFKRRSGKARRGKGERVDDGR